MERVITGDGSVTFYNPGEGDVYHSRSGARSEALRKHALPAELARRAAGADALRLLDFCFGLGYNTAAALDEIRRANPGCRVEVTALEKDPEIIRAMAGLEPGFASYGLLLPLARGLTRLEGPNFALELIMGDAARALKGLAPGFDAVFFDPFSPARAPELWSGEVFRDVARLMNPGAVLTTYSCAGWVRRNMRSAGLSPQDGPRVCRRSPSTVAFK